MLLEGVEQLLAPPRQLALPTARVPVDHGDHGTEQRVLDVRPVRSREWPDPRAPGRDRREDVHGELIAEGDRPALAHLAVQPSEEVAVDVEVHAAAALSSSGDSSSATYRSVFFGDAARPRIVVERQHVEPCAVETRAQLEAGSTEPRPLSPGGEWSLLELVRRERARFDVAAVEDRSEGPGGCAVRQRRESFDLARADARPVTSASFRYGEVATTARPRAVAQRSPAAAVARSTSELRTPPRPVASESENAPDASSRSLTTRRFPAATKIVSSVTDHELGDRRGSASSPAGTSYGRNLRRSRLMPLTSAAALRPSTSNSAVQSWRYGADSDLESNRRPRQRSPRIGAIRPTSAKPVGGSDRQRDERAAPTVLVEREREAELGANASTRRRPREADVDVPDELKFVADGSTFDLELDRERTITSRWRRRRRPALIPEFRKPLVEAVTVARPT